MTTMEEKHRVLLIGLEFVDPIFSGNGVYSRTIVRSLLLNAKYKVHVLCGRPESEKGKPVGVSTHELETLVESGELTISTVPLPVWKKLDESSSWEIFGQGASAHIPKIVEVFKPTIAIGVDWTSALPFCTLGLKELGVPFVYFIFRSFSAQTGMSENKRSWYLEKESYAAELSSSCVVLSEVDKKWNVERYTCQNPLNIFTLNPPLREDFFQFSIQGGGSCKESRKYITCCSRLEKSKRPDLFVDMVVHCSAFLKRLKLVPLLIGSKVDEEYSKVLIAKLSAVFAEGEYKVLPFQKDPKVLIEIWQQTLLNVHPSLYESYGMTICEAAAFGAPTILDSGGSIGAIDLLCGDDMKYAVDMENTKSASEYMMSILDDTKEKRKALSEKGRRARQQCLSWSSLEHCKKMQDIFQQSH